MRHWPILLIIFLFLSTDLSRAEDLAADFKSAEINTEIKKLPELEKTLQSLMEARIRVARGELIEKLKAYQITATQAGDLDEALKVREALTRLEKLQSAKEPATGDEAESKPVKFSIPRDAVRFGKSRYYVYTGPKADDWPKTGDEAQKFCADLGGHLAKIDSVEEHAFLAKLVQPLKASDGKPTWVLVDGNDVETKGTYVYSNGEPVKYFKWDTKKPTGRLDCRRIGIWTGNGLFWDAIGVTPTFICEWD